MVSQSSLKLVAASLQTGFSASVGVLSLLRGWNLDSIMSVRTDFYQVCQAMSYWANYVYTFCTLGRVETVILNYFRMSVNWPIKTQITNNSFILYDSLVVFYPITIN